MKEIAGRAWTRLERIRAELALRTSEEQLSLILESARDYAILSMTLDRRVSSWSKGAERLLGYAEKEILGKSADVIFTPEDRTAGAPLQEAEQAARDGRAANERWHVRKDGTRFWGSGSMMAMHDHAGAVCGLVKIMRDQTQVQLDQQALLASQQNLKSALELAERARADAEAAGRIKDQFLATLSHELRTPLNPVLMIASEGAADPHLPADVRADFEIVRKNIELEARLIEDMLDISRIAQGKLSLRKSPVNLQVIVSDAIELVRPAAVAKRITLHAKLEVPHAIVFGDAARLQQVFLNLLNNSVKFTPPGGTISVSSIAGADEKNIRVDVTDTGLGLTAEELSDAFRLFVQGAHAGATGSAVYGGLGLGLAIVEDLVTRHGGHVRAASAGRGQGATFSVSLPLLDGSQPAPPQTEGRALVSAPVQPLSILLVEDDPDTREALNRLLRRRRHTVIAVGSSAEAKAACLVRNFDLVVSDIGLPDGDGYELLRELLAVQPHLHAIALSGFGMQADLHKSNTAGFDVHLVKPVDVSKLDAAIAQLYPAT